MLFIYVRLLIDANSPDEYPELNPGSNVTFTYDVTNTGNVAFAAADVIVTDDNGTADDSNDDFNPEQVLDGGFNVGDVNQNNFLDVGETWKYSATDTVQELLTSETIHIEAEDFYELHGYEIEYNDFASGHELIRLYDHQGFASTTFHGETGVYDVVIGYYDENDGHAEGKFKINGHVVDSWTFDQDLGSRLPNEHTFVTRTIEHISLENGDEITLKGIEDNYEFARFDYIKLVNKGGDIYENVGTVEADGVSDSDTSGYVNPTPEPDISIEKFVEGIDANSPDEYPELTPGADVTFTYHVSNTGNVPFDADEVIVTDDNGTPDDTDDDFNPDQVLDGEFNVGDVNGNNVLDAGETWKYAKTLTVEDLSTSETIRLEAEEFHLYNYSVEHNNDASADELIRINGHQGHASISFHGETGEYDVLIGYFDENDGHAEGEFKVNGHTIDHWIFDEHLGSHLPNAHTATTRTAAEHLTIETGDVLTLKGYEDGYEFACFDYIELSSKSDGIYENVATVEVGDGDLFSSDISGYINPETTVV